MKHYGDITQLRGEQLEPVDIIIGGSPCQNLSIAGNRQGLSGEQSSLFLEQIRIVKESRKCHGKPRFMLWENVPGALTSNGGEDFRRVLEETVRIKEDSISIPRPERWANAGCIMGGGFSVAWRVHDAQYWGVPQRRRRIALVADFDGQCAGEILFEPKGLRGDSQKSGTPWEGAAGEAENCADTAVDGVKCLTPWDCQSKKVFDPDGAMSTYQAMGDGGANNVAVFYSFDALASNSMKSNNPNSGCRQVEIARTLDASIPDPSKNQGSIAVVEIYDARGNGDGNIASTITGDHNNRVTDYTAVVITQDSFIDMGMNFAPTIKSTDYKRPCVVSYTDNAKYNIRRLTPLECERLQGLPDGWTDIGDWIDTKGKKHKSADAPRYKALGNSIALPFWHWLLERFAPYLPESPTMGSLFDGIGGFPLCWERIYGKGTAVWASEIEPFCIAVTERRINGDSLNREAEELRS